MTSDVISSLGGILISLFLAYVPGVKGRFEALDGTSKRAVLALAMILVSGLSVALSCSGVIGAVVCDKPGIVGLVTALISALVANQATYKIAVEK